MEDTSYEIPDSDDGNGERSNWTLESPFEG